MRFMMLMIPKGYEQAKPGTMPDAKAVAAMMKYNEELQKAGVLLALEGLHPPSMGARVSFAGGKPRVTDGPFAEAKEVVGGYWMIQAKSREEAIEWASRCPASDNEIIEIRQVQEMSDFSPEVQKAAEGFRPGARQHRLGPPRVSSERANAEMETHPSLEGWEPAPAMRSISEVSPQKNASAERGLSAEALSVHSLR